MHKLVSIYKECHFVKDIFTDNVKNWFKYCYWFDLNLFNFIC
ncbi:Uncharacterised protein [Shewanella baltica]|nr:Uncharacterised protein [Shewanella baltica]